MEPTPDYPDRSYLPPDDDRDRRYLPPDDPDRLFLPPDDDLAPNRPGEVLRTHLAAHPLDGPALFAARLLGRRPVQDEWRRRLAAECAVGAELERLSRGGWHVLHSLPLPPGSEISHLLIGPGGVFCIATECVRAARVRADATDVHPGRGRRPQPYVRRTRQRAERATYALTRACGFPVPIHPVLVLIGPHHIEQLPPEQPGPEPPVDASPEGNADVPADAEAKGDDAAVRLMAGAQAVTALGALGGVLTPTTANRIHTLARNRHTWHGV
ncbi:nuclease-related domain-containing protein [Streptomyces ochraceiscleroticus]|uniref:Nuclease-related domain-containing protein n=1 Tax=Streptomyces ochraceiscleroticus TaxID=47761 RepID=A0ABW1MT37_9ACTN|nr:nuclease-related domain-containing protein [Streptomyces ochraceiscleroticus]